MRWMLAFALTAVGCASPGARGGSEPAARTITVEVPEPPSEAARRVVSALVAQGYAVAGESATGSAIVTAPYKHDHATDVVLTANVLPAENGNSAGSRVVLSAAYNVVGVVRNEPAVAGATGRKAAVWRRVEAVADALRAAGSQ